MLTPVIIFRSKLVEHRLVRYKLTTTSNEFIKQWQRKQWRFELPEEHFENPSCGIDLIRGIFLVC